MTRSLISRIILGALTIFITACGAKVVFDSDEGSGGAGGSGQGGSGTSSSSSSSSGMSPCDGTSSCETCINCTIDQVCVDEWKKCASVPSCLDLMYCLSGCQNVQACIDKCVATYPGAVDQYKVTAACVVCNACFNDCNGLAQGCLP